MNESAAAAGDGTGNRTVRTVFRLLAPVLFAAVVVQVGLAGYGAFHAVHAAKHKAISQKTINNAFDPHIALGYIIVLVMLVMFALALAGRLGKRSIGWSGLILLLGIAQAVLGIASESVPAIGPLHTINALAIFATTGLLSHRSWSRKSRRGDSNP